MKKCWATVLISTFLLMFFYLPAFAARREVGVKYINYDATLETKIVLSWKYLSGDTLYRTWDGRTWTQMSFSAPAPGQWVTVTSDVYVPYYGNIYFEVRKLGYNPAVDRNDSASENYTTIPVYPPLKNAHSDFSENTELCAKCHVTHAADGPMLLAASNTTELCKTCHGPGGTGSRYSVWDGTTRLKDGSIVKSLGGPIAAGSSTPWGTDVTSTHMGGIGPTPGYFVPYVRPPGEEFNCLDLCHKPHSDNNNYRLLYGSAETISAWVYNPTGLARETAYYETFDGAICYICHQRFDGAPESGHHLAMYFPENPSIPPDPDPYTDKMVYTHTANQTDVTTWNGGIAAPTTPLPLLKDKVIFCLTCHYPHGTTVTGAIYSGYDKNQNGLYDDYTTALKRMDNSGVCQNCHKK